MSLSQLKAATGLSGASAAAVAERLATQRLIEPGGPGGCYMLGEHLKERFGQTDSVADRGDTLDPRLVIDQAHRHSGDLVTAQAEPLTELSDTHRKIVEFCEVPRPLTGDHGGSRRHQSESLEETPFESADPSRHRRLTARIGPNIQTKPMCG